MRKMARILALMLLAGLLGGCAVYGGYPYSGYGDYYYDYGYPGYYAYPDYDYHFYYGGRGDHERWEHHFYRGDHDRGWGGERHHDRD